MKLVLLTGCLCLVAGLAADKTFPSDARHVVRVGRNGRQVIHRQPGAQEAAGGKVRKVVRKQRKQRKERQFIPAAPLAFNIPPPPAPLAPLRAAPAPVPASTIRLAPAAPIAPAAPAIRITPAVPAAPIAPAFRVAPAPLLPPAPAVRFAPVPVQSPVVPFVHHHHAPAALRLAPAAAPVVVANVQHAIPAPAPAIPAPAPVIAPPAPVIAPVPAVDAPLPPAPVPAPAAVEIIDVKAVPLEYGAPSTVAPEVRNSYLAPEPEVVVEEARQVETGYLGPAVEEVREASNGYLGPAVEEVIRDVEAGYLAPVVEVQEVREVSNGYLGPAVEEVREANNDYLAPAEAAPVAVEAARDVDTGYLAPRDSYIAVPAPSAPVAAVVEARVPNVKAQPKQIAILRNVFNPPSINPAFDYSYEAENGIKAEAVGTMRRVDDSDVAVMKGSYSYIGADGQVYTVDWYADETGFHPSAPHLPQPVQPNHPEVAAAVRAQIAFAAEEDAAAAASSRTSSTYLAPEPLPGYNYY